MGNLMATKKTSKTRRSAAKRPAKRKTASKATTKRKPAKKTAAKPKKRAAKAKPRAKTAGKKKRPAKPRPLTPTQQRAYISEIKTIVKQRVVFMKDFGVGETVIEPSMGVCQIAGIKRQSVDGRAEDYYIFSAGTAKVYVPMSQIENRGVRRPMTRPEVRKIYQQLKVPIHPTRGDARVQYLAYREVMKSGDPVKITKLLRELFTLDMMDELKGKEKEIMEQAKKFLVDEIAHVRDELKPKVLEDILECLEEMYRSKITKDKEARAKRVAAAEAAAAKA